MKKLLITLLFLLIPNTVFGASTIWQNNGTTTIPVLSNGVYPSITISTTSTSTFLGPIISTCFATSTGQPCITGGGSSGSNFFSNSGATTTLTTGSVLQATTASSTSLFISGNAFLTKADTNGLGDIYFDNTTPTSAEQYYVGAQDPAGNPGVAVRACDNGGGGSEEAVSPAYAQLDVRTGCGNGSLYVYFYGDNTGYATLQGDSGGNGIVLQGSGNGGINLYDPTGNVFTTDGSGNTSVLGDGGNDFLNLNNDGSVSLFDGSGNGLNLDGSGNDSFNTNLAVNGTLAINTTNCNSSTQALQTDSSGNVSCGTVGGTNFFSNSGATTTLTTGTQLVANTFNGTSTTATSTFTNASTTHLIISGVLNSFLATNAQGMVIATTTPSSGGSGNSAWTIGSGLIYNATSTDKVGIGSTTPIATLSVEGSTSSPTRDLLDVASSSGTIALSVNNKGNVGIATSTGTDVLDIVGNTAKFFSGTNLGGFAFQPTNFSSSLGLTFNDTTGTEQDALYQAQNSGNIVSDSGSNDLIAVAAGAVRIKTGSTSFGASNFVISSNGAVGIGTTSPGASLSVVGSNSSPEVIFASSTGSTTWEVDNLGHIVTGGKQPTVSGGTSSVNSPSNDDSGSISVAGTALTSVTLTFATPWAKTPVCTESDNVLVTAGDITSISTTTLVIGFGTGGVTTATVWYQCSSPQ